MSTNAVQPSKRKSPDTAPALPTADTDSAASKRSKDEDDDSSSDYDSDDDAIDLSVPEKVKKEDLLQVHFEFYDAKEGDFHSIKQQIANKLPGVCEGGELSDITDAVVTQAEVGTLVRVADTAHVFGFISALPAALNRNKSFWKKIEKKLISACPADKAKLFQSSLQSRRLGLLLSQRIINIPDHLVSKIYANLFEDIRWAITNADDPQARAAYDMKKFLLLAPFRSPDAKEKAAQTKTSSKDPRVFVRAEEKYLAAVADVSFELTLTPSEESSASTSQGMSTAAGPTRFVAMVVDVAKVSEAIDDFDNDLPPLPEAE